MYHVEVQYHSHEGTQKATFRFFSQEKAVSFAQEVDANKGSKVARIDDDRLCAKLCDALGFDSLLEGVLRVEQVTHTPIKWR